MSTESIKERILMIKSSLSLDCEARTSLFKVSVIIKDAY